MSPNEMDFDDEAPKWTIVKYKGKRYGLTEASADAARQYRNACGRAAKMTDGKVTGWEGLHDAEPLLVSQCLYELNEEGNIPLDNLGNYDKNKLVKQAVYAWPARVTKRLFDWVYEVSRIGQEAETEADILKSINALTERLAKLRSKEGKDEAKNEPGAGTATSA